VLFGRQALFSLQAQVAKPKVDPAQLLQASGQGSVAPCHSEAKAVLPFAQQPQPHTLHQVDLLLLGPGQVLGCQVANWILPADALLEVLEVAYQYRPRAAATLICCQCTVVPALVVL
jgi:hypothetical protein